MRAANPTPLNAYRPDIDGLRAIAILLVLRFHFYSLKGGFTGVDIFFVISGYLITGILLNGLAQGSLSLTEFYAKRIRRIFPALVLVLCSCLAFGYSQLFLEELQQLGKHIAAGAAYISNFVLWQEAGYFARAATTKPLLHLWSLAIEEQFYLIWPALLLLASRWRRGVLWAILGLTGLSFIANITWIHRAPEAVFYFPFSRMWELSAGGLLAYWQQSQQSHRHLVPLAEHPLGLKLAAWRNLSAIIGFTLATVGVVNLSSGNSFPGWGALLPVVGTVLMIGAGPQALLNRYLLGNKLMVWVGSISYPLYLWHWPVLVFSKALFGETSTVKAVGFILSFVLAWLTCQLIEKRFRHLDVAGTRGTRVVIWGIAISLLLVGMGVATWKGGALSRFGNVQAVSEIYDTSAYQGCIVDGNISTPYQPTAYVACDKKIADFKAQTPRGKLVLVIGDSHAWALYQGIFPFIEKQGVGHALLTTTFCPPLVMHGENPNCGAYTRDIEQRIQQLQPDLVIVSGYYTKWLTQLPAMEGMAYEKYLQQRVAELQQRGAKQVMLIGNMPTWDISLAYVLNNSFLRKGLPFPLRTHTGVVEDSLKFDTALRNLPLVASVRYASLKDLLCNAEGCLTKVGEQLPRDLMVYDYGHLTAAGAQYVVQHGLGAEIAQTLQLSAQ